MGCYNPLTAWQRSDGGPVAFKPIHPIQIQLPCGQCIGCRIDRSRMWAVRCMHEAQWYEEKGKENLYITLTYNNENLPENANLNYPDFQKFMKRLKKLHQKELIYVPDPQDPELEILVNPEDQIRFYMCGEYGEETQRPHYHALIFGWHPGDLYRWRKNRSGQWLYRSPTLENLWTLGNSEVGAVAFESAAYVARYCMKKVTGQLADDHYTRVNVTTGEIYKLTPEFNRMSLKPGIGQRWFDKYNEDLYPHDYAVVSGRKTKIPRFYDKKFEELEPEQFEAIKQARITKALERADDNTPERLAVREKVKEAQLKKLKRTL
jgi:hypothetical protein